MKRLIYGLLIFLLPVVSFASIDANLKYGARGTEVIELQEFLIEKGFLPIGNSTGNFYSLTLKAVKEYQASVQLPNTGFVGPMTRDKINTDLAINDDAEIKEVGTVTAPLQTDINAILQKQLNDLLLKVADLITQQKQLSLETNQKLGAIQQNTSPVITPVSVPLPEELPVATRLVVTVGPDDVGGARIRNGGNCELITLKAEVQNQFGGKMDVPIQVYNAQTNSTSTLPTRDVFDSTGYSIAKANYIIYRPQATSTTERFVFSYGNLLTEGLVKLGPSIAEIYNPYYVRIVSPTEYFDERTSYNFNPLTGKCL